MAGVFIIRWPFEDRYTEGKCHVTTEDWSAVARGKGTPKIVGKPPEARKNSPAGFVGSMAFWTPCFWTS